MGELDGQNKWLKLAFFFTVIGFCLLLFTTLGWGGAGGQATAVLGFFFYTGAIVLITAYIFVDEANNKIVLIVFVVASILAGILVLVQIFALRAHYNSTKGFLSGCSGIAAGVMGILALVMG